MTIGPAPPLRVEIAAVGFYTDRVVEPIKSHDADRVYLVYARDRRDDKAKPFRETIQKLLREWKRGVDIRLAPTDMWSLEGCVETFSSIIKSEIDSGNSVWVNLSTGSKLEAIGAALACMAHGGNAYYVRMKSYETTGPAHPLAEGVVSVDSVPMYGLSRLTEPQLAVLSLLAQNAGGLSKKHVLSGLVALGILPFRQSGASPLSPQASYARLQVILDGLCESPPLVVVLGHRKAARIRITPRGMLALRIFAPRSPERGHAPQASSNIDGTDVTSGSSVV